MIDPETGEIIGEQAQELAASDVWNNDEATIVGWVVADSATGETIQVLDTCDGPLPDGTVAIEQVTMVSRNTGGIVREYDRLLVPGAPLNDVVAIVGCWQQVES